MKDFSFLNTLLLVNGVPISGFDDSDTAINMERFNDSASHKISVDGIMSLSLGADRSGFIEFRLMQTSNSNLYLSGLITAQENDIFVPAFVQYKDTKGNDFASGTQGYIPRPANMPRGGVVQSQPWRIVVERLDMLHTGAQ